ncbi:MAG: GIY-YIG nuclease family protein, partial [Patescibacteria group bacterium]|nr:GIY-YIG nuclease family protein [Patescibacteria group bacterium]
MNYFVYIVRCKDDSLYTGFTWNISQRIWEHNFSKRGAKSLRGKLPVHLEYSEVYNTKTEALKRERKIKGWRKER